jgi:hypothetical protein
MSDMTYGWNLEMLMRVAAAGLPAREIAVGQRRRIGGASKVSGNFSAGLKGGPFHGGDFHPARGLAATQKAILKNHIEAVVRDTIEGCQLLAQSRHALLHCMQSAFDPKRTLSGSLSEGTQP